MEIIGTDLQYRPMTVEDIDGILAIDHKINGQTRAITYRDPFSEMFGGQLDISFVAGAESQMIGFILAKVTAIPGEVE